MNQERAALMKVVPGYLIIIKTAVVLFIFTLVVFWVTGCLSGPVSIDETVFIEVTGQGVEGENRITLKELKDMDEGLVEDNYFSINTYGTREYTRFKGVWIWYALQNSVELKDSASTVVFIAEDGYKVEYSLDDVKKEDYIDEQNPDTKYKMLLAWEQDEEEFDPEKGSPFQLVVGQKEPGDVNKPYWVRNIEKIVID